MDVGRTTLKERSEFLETGFQLIETYMELFGFPDECVDLPFQELSLLDINYSNVSCVMYELVNVMKYLINFVPIVRISFPIKANHRVLHVAFHPFPSPFIPSQLADTAGTPHLSRFWSSGNGSHKTVVVEFEIAFHGIDVSKSEVILDGSEAPVRVEARALLSYEKLTPIVKLNKVQQIVI
ncbi:hypothetical protein L2E82_12615 [Cichorium intybus]|uniref:Uncharacterized protein n=1 Tax=Cichorium intybus TaxID=13427 RepID=A0ACB9GGB8_CICIN|nr:hypothetical protein L2E82_12615 [Cichorium intybus]